MKHSNSANWALALAVIGWIAACYGAMSQAGDPSPTLAHAVYEANRQRSFFFLAAGVSCLLGSLWLSGHSFTTAKVRSMVSASAVAVPVLAIILSML